MRAFIACFAFALAASSLAATPVLAGPPPAAKGEDQIDPLAKKITGSTAYVPTFGLRATIARGYSVHGFLSVDAGLEVPSSKTRRRAVSIAPRIRSTMLEALQSYTSLSYIVGERPDADVLLIRLQKAVDGVLGKGEATVALASVIVFDR